MSVDIPWSRIAGVSAPRPLLYSGNQDGVLGGPELPIPRLGDRFSVNIRTTQLRQDAESRLLIAALTEATTEDARIIIRQPNLDRQLFGGAATVDGAGQAGSTLLVQGLVPATALVRGQFFSIVHLGQHYVHMVRGQVIASSDGKAAVPIWPMLRFLTVDGEPCAFAQPMIEGKLVGFDGKGASFVRNRVEPLDFSIVERA